MIKKMSSKEIRKVLSKFENFYLGTEKRVVYDPSEVSYYEIREVTKALNDAFGLGSIKLTPRTISPIVWQCKYLS